MRVCTACAAGPVNVLVSAQTLHASLLPIPMPFMVTYTSAMLCLSGVVIDSVILQSITSCLLQAGCLHAHAKTGRKSAAVNNFFVVLLKEKLWQHLTL